MVKSKVRDNRDGREKSLRKTFIKLLMKFPIKEVKFSGNKISLTFFGHRISDHIRVQKEDHVADWSRRRKEIFVDKKVSSADRKKSFRALCVHEVIEKFVAEKFGLVVDTEAHLVAHKKEREYLESVGGNWRSHEEVVYWDWHKLGEH